MTLSLDLARVRARKEASDSELSESEDEISPSSESDSEKESSVEEKDYAIGEDTRGSSDEVRYRRFNTR